MRRYHYLNRPPGIGCQPPGFANREAWLPSQRIPGSAHYAYGWVEYTRPLSFEHVWRYDLRPANQGELDAYNAWRDKEGK